MEGNYLYELAELVLSSELLRYFGSVENQWGL